MKTNKKQSNKNAPSVVNTAMVPHNDDKIIIYQPDSTIKLDVLIQDETVWLTQAQMAELFDKDQSVIARHILNVFNEGELEKNSNMQILHNTFFKYKPTQVYNLDVIISVGYRVKSQRGTMFRRWASKVLKEYLLRGYAVNQKIIQIEDRMDRRLLEHDMQILELRQDVDFFVKTALPPREGVFFDGQIFDAYRFVCDLVGRAKQRIVLIDNYVDGTVLALLDKRTEGVSAQIYTQKPAALDLDLKRHNAQYAPIDVAEAQGVHDRFLIIDDTVYHIGASIKDLGKKLFAFSKMELEPEVILGRVEKRTQ